MNITLDSGEKLPLNLARADEIRGAMNRAVRLFEATQHMPRSASHHRHASEVCDLVAAKAWLMDQVPYEVLQSALRIANSPRER